MSDLSIKITALVFLMLLLITFVILIRRLINKNENEIKLSEVILGTIFAFSIGKGAYQTDVSKSPNTMLGVLIIASFFISVLFLILLAVTIVPTDRLIL